MRLKGQGSRTPVLLVATVALVAIIVLAYLLLIAPG